MSDATPDLELDLKGLLCPMPMVKVEPEDQERPRRRHHQSRGDRRRLDGRHPRVGQVHRERSTPSREGRKRVRVPRQARSIAPPTTMDWFSYLASAIGVYVALSVFTLGMAWRAWQWSRTPKSAVRLGLFPKPDTGLGRFGKLLKDTFVAPQSVAIATGVMIAALRIPRGGTCGVRRSPAARPRVRRARRSSRRRGHEPVRRVVGRHRGRSDAGRGRLLDRAPHLRALP